MSLREILRKACAVLSSLTIAASCAASSIYIDPSALAGGDGSEDRPINRLGLIDWNVISNRISAGQSVDINLRRGRDFHELFALGASGRLGNPLRIQGYGVGSNPVLRGDNRVTGWLPDSNGQGQTWSVPVPSPVNYLWLNGRVQTKAIATNALGENEWIWTGGRLYLRMDAGNPDTLGADVTVAARSYSLTVSGRSHITVEGIEMRHASAYSVRLLNSAEIKLRGCRLVKAGGQLEISSVTNVSLVGCTIEEGYGLPLLIISGVGTVADAYFCQFRDARASSGILVNSCRTLNLVNCNIIGVRNRGLDNASTGLVNIRNCLISAVGQNRDVLGGEAISSSAGTVAVGHSLVLPNGRNPNLHMKSVVDLGGNIYREPRFRQTRREGLWTIMEDDYPSLDGWTELARLAKFGYGFGTTLAINSTDRIHPEHVALIQQLINEGHEVISHTRSHADVSRPDAFFIQYVGAGMTCEMTVSNGWLRTSVARLESDNLEISLNAGAGGGLRLEQLIPTIDAHPAYTCTYVTAYNHSVPVRLLQATNDLDIKTARVKFPFDKGRFFTNELWLSKADLERIFNKQDGGDYECRYLVYPGGYVNDEAITNAIEAGYLGGRIDSPAGGAWQLESFDTFMAQVAVGINGHVLTLGFENSLGDASPIGNAFSNSNMVFSTNSARLTYAGRFNGSNSYIFRTNSSSFDFSKGDMLMSCRLRPDDVSRTQVIFSMGMNQDGGFQVLIESNGAVGVRLMAGGEETFSFATTNGVIVPGRWQKVTVQQLFDVWSVRVNDVVVGGATNAARLGVYSEDIYIGCAHSSLVGERERFYGGYIDDFSMANGAFFKTQAAAALLSEVGGVVHAMSHGESGTPREVWRVVLDALDDYSGDLRVMTYTETSDYIRSNGVLKDDRRTVVRTNFLDQPNYNLRLDSPAVGAASTNLVVGVPHLMDANGSPVTDGDGQLLLPGAGLSIGAMQLPLEVTTEHLPVGTLNEDYRFALTSVGGSGDRIWAVAPDSLPLPAGLSLSTDGVLSGAASTPGDHLVGFVVTDGSGLVVKKTLMLQVVGSRLPPIIRGIEVRDQVVTLHIQFAANSPLIVEASSDLLDWQVIGKVTASGGRATWSEMWEAGRRFFRVRTDATF